MVISTTGLYGAFLLLSRMLGQRVLARLSGFDLLVVIVFGAIIGRAILGQVPTFAAVPLRGAATQCRSAVPFAVPLPGTATQCRSWSPG